MKGFGALLAIALFLVCVQTQTTTYWTTNGIPTQVSIHENYRLYSFCLPVDVEPTSDYVVEMYIQFQNTDNSEISIDWSNDNEGIVYHESQVNAVTLYAKSAPTDANWTPIWKKSLKAASFSGLIASRDAITDIKFIVISETFEPLLNTSKYFKLFFISHFLKYINAKNNRICLFY